MIKHIAIQEQLNGKNSVEWVRSGYTNFTLRIKKYCQLGIAILWLSASRLLQKRIGGLSKFTWIYSPSAMSQVSTDVAIDNTANPTFIKTFFSKSKADEWLITILIALWWDKANL